MRPALTVASYHCETAEWGLQRGAFQPPDEPAVLFGWPKLEGRSGIHNRFVLKTGGSWSQFTDAKARRLITQIDSEMDRDKRKA